MRHIKNNKGSILALVIIVIGVLSVIGTSILTAAVANYKVKLVNTTFNSNLYIAEAGFEETYSKIYNIISSSMKEANSTAKLELSKYNDELFQQTVFLIESEKHNISEYPYLMKVDEIYQYNEEYIKNQVEQKFSEKYKDSVAEKLRVIIVSDKITSDIDTNIDITALTDFNFNLSKLKIDLSSKYIKNDIQRAATATLFISVPKYNEPFTVSTITSEIPVNPLWTKVIATDGDLTINNSAVINGDIYTKNNININNLLNTQKQEVTFNNEVSAVGSIIANDNMKLAFSDIYTNKLLLEGENIDLNAKAGLMAYSGIYIKDDFIMNNIKQNVVIDGNYYGFSDGLHKKGADNSSSIAINSNDILSGSSLNINGDLYLLGTSYIASLYQTGESIAVKGNYTAYTEELTNNAITDSNFLSSNIEFDYDYYEDGTILPLYLAQQFISLDTERDKKLNVDDKNKYFYYYYLENKDEDDAGGLKIKNINVAGNSITLGNTMKASGVQIGKGISIISQLDKFNECQQIYEYKTNMLADATIDDIKAKDSAVDSSIYINKDCNFSEDSLSETIDGIKYIYNTDSSKTIDINLGSDTYYGFIVTNGDVVINGTGSFSGCIIAQAGVKINSTSTDKVILSYNDNVVLRGLSTIDKLYNAFYTAQKYKDYKFKYYSSEIYNSETSDDKVINVDYSSLIKFENWNIENE